jgi:hypothetical protein
MGLFSLKKREGKERKGEKEREKLVRVRSMLDAGN